MKRGSCSGGGAEASGGGSAETTTRGGKAHGCWKRGKAMEKVAGVYFSLRFRFFLVQCKP